MKNTRTIVEFATEIARQQQSKVDFVINTKNINAFSYTPQGTDKSHLELGFELKDESGKSELMTAPLTITGHEQMADLCKIDKRYYDRMKGASAELLAYNVRYWLEKQSDRRMIRMLDGNVRAIRSSTYRRLDNYDLLQSILPILSDAQLVIDGSEITERRMYLKARNPKIQAEVAVGDVVESGVIITNSEIGEGSLSVKPFIYRLVCKNGAVIDKLAMRKYHSGGRLNEELDGIQFQNDTLMADDKAFFLKVRDLVTHSMSQVTFDAIVDTMRESTERKIIEPTHAIKLAKKEFKLTDKEEKDVLKHLIEGGSLTSWGMGNAITRLAHDVESYDRSVELETVGYEAMMRNWN